MLTELRRRLEPRHVARAALLRYVRARPRPEELAGAERRVFIVLSTAWGMGGTIRTTLNLAAYLSRSHEVHLISVGRWRDEPFFEFPGGVRVVNLVDHRAGLLRPLRRLLTKLSSVLMHPLDNAASGFSLWADLRLARALRRRAGFLIATRAGYNLIAADLKPPGLVTIGQEHLNLRKQEHEMRRAMRRWYPKLDALTVLTEPDRLAYERLLKGRVRVVRIPNSVRRLEGPNADLSANVVLAAGRLSRQKGYDRLVRAFAEVAPAHPAWRLRICGDGPLRGELEALIAELRLEAQVELAPPTRDLGPEMAAASIFALSSRFEGLPLTLLEAMSKGMAVVSFDCPTGPADVIDDRRNGLLVPPRDVEAFAAAIRELIEDEELRRRCAAAAVETSRRYTIEAIGPQWEELFRDLREAQSG